MLVLRWCNATSVGPTNTDVADQRQALSTRCGSCRAHRIFGPRLDGQVECRAFWEMAVAT